MEPVAVVTSLAVILSVIFPVDYPSERALTLCCQPLASKPQPQPQSLSDRNETRERL